MRKVQEIKDEIHSVIDRLSALAKELHVSEYVSAGDDDSPVTIVMNRKLAASLFGYAAGSEAITPDQAFEVAACVSQALTLPSSPTKLVPKKLLDA